MTSEQNYECIKCGSIMTHTRAVPDVPELVRYDKSDICLAIENGYDALPSDDGEYVLHSQAEAIIAAEQMKLEATAKVGLQLSEQIEALEADNAAKDAEIELIKDENPMRDSLRSHWVARYTRMKQRAEAAEAELDHIKAQEPVAWLCEYLEGDAPKSITTFALSAMIKLKNEGCEIVPLYTAPIDHTAEIERYREQYREAVRNAFKDSNAALSGEEPS